MARPALPGTNSAAHAVPSAPPTTPAQPDRPAGPAAATGRRRGRWRNFAGLGAFKAVSAPVQAETDPDVQLMLAVQSGDGAAFQQLFEKHVAGVVGFATQFVGNRARAEELAQDVFLQIYRTRARYVPSARFRTWLYRMVSNACLSEVRRPDYRARAHSSAMRSVNTDEGPALPIEIPTRSTEDDLLTREAIDGIRAALTDLPEQQRAALLLARVEGLSYDEVAASLSCSVSAVKSLIHRATVTLRERLQEGEER